VATTTSAAVLNARFARSVYGASTWEPGRMLADAGLLVHVFDDWERHGRPWEPDTLRPEMSTSLIFASQRAAFSDFSHQIPLFGGSNGGTAGLILRPGITRINCGKPVDSAGDCPGADKPWRLWCSPARKTMPFVEGVDKLCAWHVTDFGPHLKRLTEFQARYHSLLQYNEVVVDSAWWRSHLPGIVEAVFGDANAHRAFLDAFRSDGVSEETHPFVRLDRGDWNAPIK